MSKYIRINAALKPPVDIAQKIITLSQDIAKEHKSYFVLDNKNYFPHFTVYSPEYPINRAQEIPARLKEIAKNQISFRMNFKEIGTNQGYIGLHFELTPEIKGFHVAIVEALNPLREGHLRDKYKANDYKMELSQEKLDNIDKYGYPSAMNLYHPHMTIIRLPDAKVAESLAQKIKWDENFIVDTLALYKMSDHGTCVEQIEEFKLL